jgi:hypothetical protein
LKKKKKIHYVIHGKQRQATFILGAYSVNNSAYLSITFQICCRICHKEDTSKLGTVETEWHISASVNADDISLSG